MCYPDGPYVQEVARFVGTDHTDVTLSADELMDRDVRTSILHARDLPFTSADTEKSWYLLFRAIRQHSTVALPESRQMNSSAATHGSTIPRILRPTRFLGQSPKSIRRGSP